MSSFLKLQVIGRFCVAVVVLALSGCAAPSYVVLLPDEDGSLGKVSVTNPKGVTTLDQKNQGAVLGGAAGETFQVSEAQLLKDFGAALAASPKKPLAYLLYFQSGGVALTQASQAELQKIKEDIKTRAGSDLSVIGHTDTMGDDEANVQLGLTRARTVANLIGTAEISAARVSIESHGEKNLLIPTPDKTDEPRNRRVEVIVR